MFIAICGPTASGKTTIATKLFDHFDSIGVDTHMIRELIHGTNLNSSMVDIYAILQNIKEGIIITDGLEVDCDNFVQFEKNGNYYSPDIILRTSTEDYPTQMWITKDVEFEDILKSISIVQNIKKFEN